MFDLLNKEYTLFIRYDDDELSGIYTLRDDDIYKDIIELELDQMKFLLDYPSVFHSLSNDYALSLSYDHREKNYVSSIKKSTKIGEYNDEIVWNDIVECKDITVEKTLEKLNDEMKDNDKIEKNLTLVILAAGMGSRFGGLKQIEPVGPNGEFIIDYSIYDAVSAGFNKVIFIIQEENYLDFKETIGKRVEDHVKVCYVFQKNDHLPDGYEQLEKREKPLGTAHAFFSIEHMVKEPFMIINADDFYGKDAYIQASHFLRKNYFGEKHRYGLIGYLVKNTMTEFGAVKRGVLEVKQNQLVNLVESNVSRMEDKIIAKPLNGNSSFEVLEDQMVSMNMLLFNPTIFPFIQKKWIQFLDENKNDLEKCEFLIPNVLIDSVSDGYADVDVISTNSNWYGVTYREDLSSIKNAIKKLINQGIYSYDLWK